MFGLFKNRSLYILTLLVLFCTIPTMAQNPTVTIPNVGAPAGKDVYVDIQTSSLTGLQVFSMDLKLLYDTSILQYIQATSSGTISSVWGTPTINSSPGQLSIAFAGVDPLSGSGKLIRVKFHVQDNAVIGSTSQLSFLSFQFNEGQPAATVTNGIFTVQADQDPPVITGGPSIQTRNYKDVKIFVRTDELSTVKILYGESTAYGSSVADNNLKTDHSVQIQNLNETSTYHYQLQLTDSHGNGPRISSDYTFTTKEVTLSLPNKTADPGTNVEIPVTVPNLTELNISKIGFDIGFDPSQLQISGISTANTVLSNWPSPQVTISNNQISFLVENTVSIQGGGDLVFLKGNIPNNATLNQTSSLSWINANLNNGTIRLLTNNGSLTVKDRIAPNITAGPDVSNVKSNSVTIKWQTNETATSLIDFGETSDYSIHQQKDEFIQIHEFNLTNLMAGTTYHYRIGGKDESGNGPSWSADATFTTASAEVSVEFPDVAAASGSILWVPVKTSDVSGYSVKNWNALIGFDPNYLEYSGIDQNGTLVQNWAPVQVTSNTGFLTISASGSSELSGAGELIKIGFNVKQVEGQIQTPVEFLTFQYDNDWPTVSSKRGFVTISGTQDQIAPKIIWGPFVDRITNTSSRIFWKTDELSSSFVEFGTSLNYGQNVSASALDTIHQISLTGLQANTIYHYRVRSADAAGNNSVFSSDSIFTSLTGNGVSVTIPNLSVNPGQTIDVPIQVGNLSGLNVFSSDLTISYDATYLSAQSVSGSGTLSSTWGDPVFSLFPGQVVIAMGGIQALAGSGNLVKIRFRVADNAPAGGYIILKFDSFVFNEGNPLATFEFGKIKINDKVSPTLLSGPNVLNIKTNSAIITWQTDEPSDSRVTFGIQSNNEYSTENSSLTMFHSILLDGLLANTTYKYKISSIDSVGNIWESSQPFEFTTKSINQITFQVGNKKADRGQSISLPVTISGNNSRPVNLLRFELVFNHEILQLQDITLTATGTSNWQSNVQELSAGKYQVELQGDQPISQEGELFQINFLSLNAAYNSTSNINLQNIFVNNDDSNINSQNGIFELIDLTPPVFHSNPIASQIREKSANISWQTNELTTSLLVYGTIGGKLDTVKITVPASSFSYDLTNLLPITNYRYRVGIKDVAGNGSVWSDFNQFTTTSGNEVDVSLPDTTFAIGSVLEVPLKIGDPKTISVSSYHFDLIFDPAFLEFLGPNQTNSLTSSWSAPNVVVKNDTINLEHSGTGISQAGDLIHLRFKIRENTPHDYKIFLQFFNFMFNNGAPPAAVSNGSITGKDLTAPEFLSVPEIISSRLKSVLIKVRTDEHSKLNLRFGDSNTNLNNLIEITDFDTTHSIEIKNLQPNQTYYFQVESFDSLGNGPNSSSVIEFQTLQAIVEISIPDTLGKIGSEISLPVNISNITDFGLTKYQVQINYNGQKISPLGVSVTGSLSEKWGSGLFSNDGQSINFSHSGAEPLGGEGVLFFLRFSILESSVVNDTTQIRFGGSSFQDGVFPTNTSPGSIQFEKGVVQRDIFVTFPDTTITAGVPLTLGLKISDVTDLEISSYSFIVEYDHELLNLKQLITANTISASWSSPAIYHVGDSLFISNSGSEFLAGVGNLLQFEFETKTGIPPESKSNLNLVDFKFNDGKPKAITQNGSITLVGKPNKIIGFVKNKLNSAEGVPNAKVTALTNSNTIAAQTVADNSGYFELENLDWQIQYNLVAEKSGYSPSDTLKNIVPDFTVKTIFLLKQDGVISGQINSSDGLPISNALILVDNSRGNFGSANSGLNGDFKIENLDRRFPYQVTITKSGFGRVVLSNVVVDSSLDVILAFQYGKIFGQTLDAQNQPVSNVSIKFYYLNSGELVHEIFTDSNGGFSQDSLKTDRYLITAQKPEFISSPKQHIVDLYVQLENQLEFRLKPYQLASLKISGDLSIPNDKSTQFSYTALSQEGETIDNLTNLQWSLEPEMAGTISEGILEPDSSYIGVASIFLNESSGFLDTLNVFIYANISSDQPYFLQDANGMEIQIPMNSVSNTIPIRFDSEKPQSIKGSTRAYLVVGNGYDFKPDGTQFLAPILLKLPIPAQYLNENLVVGRWNPDRAQWIILGGTKNSGKNQIEVTIDHFSLFALLLESQPLGIHQVTFTPNPFSPDFDTDGDGNLGVQIEFMITSKTIRQPFVNVKIYSLLGELVKELLINEPMDKGQVNSINWDGRTDLGRLARNGRYIVQIEVKDDQGTETHLGQIILVK